MSNLYKLCIKVDNKEVCLLESNLENIDKFTTFFKNKEMLLSNLLDQIDIENAKLDLFVRDRKGKRISFIGSDFQNVQNLFSSNSQEYLDVVNAISSLDKNVLYNYFSSIKNGKEIIKILDALKTNDSVNLENELKYTLRNYCGKYENFRSIYSFIVGFGVIKNEKPKFTDKDIKDLETKFNSIQEKLGTFMKFYAQKKTQKIETRSKLFDDAKKAAGIMFKKFKKQTLFADAKTVAGRLYVDNQYYKQEKKSILRNEAFHSGKKMYKKDRLIDDARNIGIGLFDKSIKGKLSKEATSYIGKFYSRINLGLDAVKVGRNLFENSNKYILIKEAQNAGKKMYRKDELSREATEVVNGLFKNIKKRNLKQSATKLGYLLYKKSLLAQEANKLGKSYYLADKKIEDENFDLEFIDRGEEKSEEFQNYLNNQNSDVVTFKPRMV